MSRYSWATARKLREKGDARGLAQLLADPSIEKQPQLRSHIVLVLGQLGGPTAIDTLVRALHEDSERTVRVDAAFALANLASNEVENEVETALIEALRDEGDY